MQTVKWLAISPLVLVLRVIQEILSDTATLSLSKVNIDTKTYFNSILTFTCYLDIKPEPTNPCQPSPCGPNSQCREVNSQAVCSCLPNYIGSPPGCRPECVVSTECSSDKACVNQKCIDPCPGTCGISALCQVINHSPICSCKSGNTGNPFTRCFPIPRKIYLNEYMTVIFMKPFLAPPPIHVEPQIVNPCVPSPCGPNSQCRDVGSAPSCSCLPNFFGSPPNCRPECTINSECSSNLACINQKCVDPCPGSCGIIAECNVFNHIPTCSCPEGYTGDPFSSCIIKPIRMYSRW